MKLLYPGSEITLVLRLVLEHGLLAKVVHPRDMKLEGGIEMDMDPGDIKLTRGFGIIPFIMKRVAIKVISRFLNNYGGFVNLSEI